MNRRDIAAANALYIEDFGNPMSPEALEIAERVKTIDDLYTYPNEEVLSAGEFDALECVLEGRS